ncbi:MAG: hypothetical protein JWM88_369 [Verrucomicrobia bacterium]|nr:hypothetical protein [Verrucomicrobiota bacterium]
MKTSLCGLVLLSLALAACARKDDQRSFADQTKDAAATAVDKTRAATVEMKNTLTAKLTEWQLTPDDIRADLKKGGRIARSKTAAATEKFGAAVDNARIAAVINAKLLADDDLSALKINVEAHAGQVTLTGTVSSPELIGKAMVLALDTDGVREVASELRVE